MWLTFLFFKDMKTKLITNRRPGKKFPGDFISKKRWNNPRRKMQEEIESKEISTSINPHKHWLEKIIQINNIKVVGRKQAKYDWNQGPMKEKAD